VTLTGTVRWPDEKSEVEGVVRGIDGVERIVNNITVAYGAKEGRLNAP
jgi:osmotically-inducible protein OsmY